MCVVPGHATVAVDVVTIPARYPHDTYVSTIPLRKFHLAHVLVDLSLHQPPLTQLFRRSAKCTHDPAYLASARKFTM